MKKEICKDDSFTLFFQQPRKLILAVKDGDQIKQIYQGDLPLIDQDQLLTNKFYNQEELLQHLKDLQNFHVELETRTLRIVDWLKTTRRSREVCICEIHLSKIKTQEEEELINFMQMGEKQEEISQLCTKQNIKTISESLLQIISAQNIHNSQSTSGYIDMEGKLEQISEQVSIIIEKKCQQMFNRRQKKQRKFVIQEIFSCRKVQNEILQKKLNKISQNIRMQYEKIPGQVEKLIKNIIQTQIDQKVKTLVQMFTTSEQSYAIANKLRLIGNELEKTQQEVMELRKSQTQAYKSPEKRWFQPYMCQFNINRNIVRYIGPNFVQTNFILNKKIPYDTDYSFKIRVVHSGQRDYNIAVGILNQKDKFCRGVNNGICYLRNISGQGQIFPSQMHRGNGIRPGDVVQVLISLRNQTVRWIVGGRLEAQEYCREMAEPGATYFPFVQFYCTNSQVQWLED